MARSSKNPRNSKASAFLSDQQQLRRELSKTKKLIEMDSRLRQETASDGSMDRNYVKNQKAQIEKENSQHDLTVFEEIRSYGDEVDAVSDGNDGWSGEIDDWTAKSAE